MFSFFAKIIHDFMYRFDTICAVFQKKKTIPVFLEDMVVFLEYTLTAYTPQFYSAIGNCGIQFSGAFFKSPAGTHSLSADVSAVAMSMSQKSSPFCMMSSDH